MSVSDRPDIGNAQTRIMALEGALKECADRLERAALTTGSDPEFAAAAVEKYRTLLASPQ